MIILDTNVLSALMHKAPEAPVAAWLDRQPAESVRITSIVRATLATRNLHHFGDLKVAVVDPWETG